MSIFSFFSDLMILRMEGEKMIDKEGGGRGRRWIRKVDYEEVKMKALICH